MSASKAKGTRFESDCVAYLNTHGHPYAERKAQQGNHDKGDLTGIPGWTFELKATKRIELAATMDELDVEMVNAGTEWGAAIFKRPRRTIAEAYFVMPLFYGAELVRIERSGWGDTP